MTPLRRVFAAAIITACILALILGCSSEPGERSVVTYGLTLSPTGIDPHINASDELGIPLTSVYDTLVFQDPQTGAVVPGLAHDWTISDDGLVYTFFLREDVVFHDGTPFNADAVVANLDYVLNPDNHSQRAAFMLGPIDGVEAIDDHTVQLKLRQPFAPLLDSLSQVYLGMASPTALAEWGPSEYAFHQVGTGPYRFVEYVPDDHLTLERNPDYAWAPSIYGDRQGQIDSLVFKFYVDPATRLLALQGGQVDVIGELPPRDAARVETSEDFALLPVAIPGQPLQLMFNTLRPPTDDVSVRRALIMSVDRASIVKTVFGDYSPVAEGPLASYGNPPSSVTPYMEYDPAGAEDLLSRAGWEKDPAGALERAGSPMVLNIVVPSWGSNPEVGQLIKAAWEGMGAKVALTVAPGFGQLKELQADGDYSAIGYYTFGTDPDLLRSFFHTDGAYNWTGVHDPELDHLLDQAARTTGDPEERKLLYQQAASMIDRLALILPIRDYVDLIGYNRRLQGLRFSYQGWFPLLIDLRLAP
jgi:peptide/nickel transport system substrate-binding protein